MSRVLGIPSKPFVIIGPPALYAVILGSSSGYQLIVIFPTAITVISEFSSLYERTTALEENCSIRRL